jgi:hypothetical protein
MSVIDRVKTHFETLKTITIEVNEWKDEHGNSSILHLTIQQVLDMPVSHYNLWLAYLKKEQDEYKTKQSLAEARKYK